MPLHSLHNSRVYTGNVLSCVSSVWLLLTENMPSTEAFYKACYYVHSNDVASR